MPSREPVWVDDDGAMHVDLDAMLESEGYPVTEENRRRMLFAYRQYCLDHGVTLDEAD